MKDFLKVLLYMTISLTMIYAGKVWSNTSSHKEVVEICKHYNKRDGLSIDCNLVSALIKTESDYQIESYHSEKTGSYGLMQIQCGTAKMVGLKYGCEQLFGKKANIRFGMKYLQWIKDNLYSKHVKNIIASYNAGFKIAEQETFERCHKENEALIKRGLFTSDKLKKECEVKGKYMPLRCDNYNKFQWQDFPPVECYPGELINEEYVWKVYRRYKYLVNKSKEKKWNN